MASSRRTRRARSAAAPSLELDLVRLADALAGGGKHVRFIGRGREQDARGRRRPRQLRRDQERRPRQGMRRIEVGAAAVGEEELAGRAAGLADALRVRERQQPRGRHLLSAALSRPPARTRHPRPAGRQPSHVAGAARAIAAEPVQPVGEIGIVAAEPALHDHRGDLGGRMRVAQCGRDNHHARQPGRQRQRPQPPADGGDAAVRVERLQPRQLLARRVDGGGRRRIDPRQGARIGGAPIRAVEQQPGQIGGADLGLGEGGQALRLPLVPQAIADAGLGPAGAAPPLIGRCARHPHGLQPRHAHVRLEPRHPRQAAVDHHPHALDGDRGLGDGGGEHHLADAGGRRPQRQVLRLHVHRAVEGCQHDAGSSMRSASRSSTRRISPWPGRNARMEPVSARSARITASAIWSSMRACGIAAEIARLHRKGAALAGDDGSVAQDLRHPRAVQRRRHRQDAQVLAEAALAVERESQPQVGVERALVELVEQDCADAGELRVVQDHAGEDALGDDLDARLRPRLRDHARPQSDSLAHSLRQGLRHALGCGPRGDTARLQHQHLPALEPAFLHQRQRHARRLAGAGRRDQNGASARRQGGAHLVENGVNRQWGGERHAGCIPADGPFRKARFP